MPSSALPRFCLGSFSIAGCKPFVGLVVGDTVVAVHAINGLGGMPGGRIHGAESMLELLGDWGYNLPLLREAARLMNDVDGGKLKALGIPVLSLRVHAPLEKPGQILMARANYRKHIVALSLKMGRGSGNTESERRADLEKMVEHKAAVGDPFLWVKTQSAVTGPYDEILIPSMTEKADWEVELAVVIGKPARNIGKNEVLDHVAGYCIANDLSARDLLVRDEFGPAQDWLAAKCAPQFMPIGPYLVPAEFVANPNDLGLELKHNGVVMQSERSSDMIHDVQTIISYASRLVQLMPGDVISTGSPSGNGMEFGVYLKDGDVVEANIEGLGTQRNVFRREKRDPSAAFPI